MRTMDANQDQLQRKPKFRSKEEETLEAASQKKGEFRPMTSMFSKIAMSWNLRESDRRYL